MCYAEKKTHALVPFLSTTRSAQQIMGTLLRTLLPDHVNLALSDSDIYITSIVSCYDRKLEASRRDFLDSSHIPAINCVLTSQEILELLQRPLPPLPSLVSWDEEWWRSMESRCLTCFDDVLMSSGGVLKSIVGEVMQKNPSAKLKTRTVRNSDFVEVEVDAEEQVLFSGAFVYGFRNIQNLAMKMKRKKCSYDVVEVMACPSGCLNGGGQIRPEKREDVLKIASELGDLYAKEGRAFSVDEIWDNVKPLYDALHITRGSEEAYSLFHTRFHVIPEVTINSLHW